MEVLQSRVLLRPADFDTTSVFYEDVLGLSRYREWGERGWRGVVLFLGGGFLELTEGEPLGVPTRALRLWLQVADVSWAHRQLLDRGLGGPGAGGDVPGRILTPPERKPWGLIEMELDDPDGVRIHVIETPLDHPLRRRED